MYLKLLTAVLFIFVSFQALGKKWWYSDSRKIECRFTRPLQTIHLPTFDCSGDFTNDLSSICKGSIECKNHEDIKLQFPHYICSKHKND